MGAGECGELELRPSSGRAGEAQGSQDRERGAPRVALGELRARGADAVLLARDELPGRVAEVTNREPIRLEIDPVASEAAARLTACLADGGLVVNPGSLTREACHIPSDSLFWRDLGLRGFSTTCQPARRSAAEGPQVHERLATWVADCTLRVTMIGCYPRNRYADVLAHALRTGAERDGTIVLVCESRVA